MSWIKTNLKRIVLDMMLTDKDSRILSKLDPKQIVEQLKSSGAEVVTLWFKDENGFALYPTKYGPMHPNLKGYNFSGEMVKRLKEFGIKVVAYYIVGMDWNYAKTHPDEQTVFSDYKPGTFPMPCINNDSYRQYVFNQIREIIQEYDVDGIWLDCIFYPQKDFFPDPDSPDYRKSHAISCFCKTCQRKFKLKTGLKLAPGEFNRGSESWIKWVKHRKMNLDSFVKEARLLVKSINPNIEFSHNLMSFNQHDWRSSLSWQTADYDDWLSAEAYHEWTGYLQISLLPRLLRAAANGKPYEAIILSYSRLWDWTVKPLPQMIAEAMIITALGGAVAVDDHISPFGLLEPKMYQRIKKVFSHIDQVKPYTKNNETFKYAAVIYSEQTRDYYACGDPRKYQSSFDGVCRSLIEEKIPFDVIMAEQINLEELKKYKVIILPNTACLDSEAIRVLDNVVENGVGIVATYATSLYDSNGTKRDQFGLKSLGVSYLKEPNYPHIFYQFNDEPEDFIRNIETNIPINMNKPYISTKGIGKGIGHIRHPMVWACNHHYRYYENPPGEYSNSPALWINENPDKGRTVYFPCDIGAAYGEYTLPEAKHLFVNAVVWAGGELPFKLDAPLSVEMIPQWQKDSNRIIIYLINFPSAPLRTAKIGGIIDSVQIVEEIPKVHQIRLNFDESIRKQITKVTSLKLGNLGWQKGDKSVIISVLNIYDVIILDLMEQSINI